MCLCVCVCVCVRANVPVKRTVNGCDCDRHCWAFIHIGWLGRNLTIAREGSRYPTIPANCLHRVDLTTVNHIYVNILPPVTSSRYLYCDGPTPKISCGWCDGAQVCHIPDNQEHRRHHPLPGPLPVWAIFPSPMQGLVRQAQWLLNKVTQDSNRLRVWDCDCWWRLWRPNAGLGYICRQGKQGRNRNHCSLLDKYNLGTPKPEVCFLMEVVLQPGLSNYLTSVSTSNFYSHRLQERCWNLFCLLLPSCTLEPFSGHWLSSSIVQKDLHLPKLDRQPRGVVRTGAKSAFTKLRSGQTGSHTIFWLGGFQEYTSALNVRLGCPQAILRIAPTNLFL